MQGGVQPAKRRLKLQIRATNLKARSGSTFWSNPVDLDALGGAAVVMVPCPSPVDSPDAMLDSPEAYMLAVTAAQVSSTILPSILGGRQACCRKMSNAMRQRMRAFAPAYLPRQEDCSQQQGRVCMTTVGGSRS